MAEPRYTVIVPMHRYRAEEPILLSLKATRPSTHALEILVVEGNHPARQRNAALERARGEIIVFLDNDCRLSPGYWEELDAAFARPEVEVVGGPALLRPEASDREKIFHALLTHPLVVGPVSARYAPRGAFRRTTQTELILCNLAARRTIFARIGPLSHRLYPNEESEWLERAQIAGTGIFYDPKLAIFRPQRATWSGLLLMLLRYGSGRTRQFWVSGWRATPYQLTPLILLLPPASLLLGPPYPFYLARLWLLASFIVAITCHSPLKLWQRAVAGLAAPLVPFTYALGQLFGWGALLLSPPPSDLSIIILNERGEPIDNAPHSPARRD